jgi:copper oxidase (laccase) domain-containing protein
MEAASGPVHLDLPTVNEKQLRELGVMDIWKSGECTFCRVEPVPLKGMTEPVPLKGMTGHKFFSFRRERERAGRMISFIGVRCAEP